VAGTLLVFEVLLTVAALLVFRMALKSPPSWQRSSLFLLAFIVVFVAARLNGIAQLNANERMALLFAHILVLLQVPSWLMIRSAAAKALTTATTVFLLAFVFVWLRLQ